LIERKFVAENLKEFQIEEYLRSTLGKAGLSYIKLQRTPVGEKILICSSRPGLVVGKSGSNITRLTTELKTRFKLENPQIELIEADQPWADANIVAEGIANSLERFGTTRFKGIGHKAMTDVMNGGARGVEILISGKIPSSRAKTWRFYMGYIKKSGDVAVSGINTAYTIAKLKTGVVGVQVRIMPGYTKLPDDVEYLDAMAQDTKTGATEKISADQAIANENAARKEAKKTEKKAAPKKGEKKAADKTTKTAPKKKAAPKKDTKKPAETDAAKDPTA